MVLRNVAWSIMLVRLKTVTVLDWLLDSDPAIRWQALRDLTDALAEVVRQSAPAWPPRAGVPGCWTWRARTACGRAARCSRAQSRLGWRRAAADTRASPGLPPSPR